LRSSFGNRGRNKLHKNRPTEFICPAPPIHWARMGLPNLTREPAN